MDWEFRMSKSSKNRKTKRKEKNIKIAVVTIVLILAAVYYFGGFHTRRTEYGGTRAHYSSVYNFTKNGELTFTSAKGEFLAKIDIEIAETEAKREQGLMYRNSMEENQGMLFIFEKDEYQSFWMKNTVIPLDMIFVNSHFKIVTIRKNAHPFDLSSYSSTAPAKYVIEVNAGFCDKYGIKEGDKISFRVF